MIQPPFLKKGDTIGIVAPGRKLAAELLHASVKLVESWGVHVRVGSAIQSQKHSYLSGTDEERLSDLQGMLDDREIKVILCARGGYGTTRILDQLNFDHLLKTPKWVCGFSDITALHLKLHKNGIQSIHSTMPVLFSNPETKSSIESLFAILSGKQLPIETNGNPLNRVGTSSGQLVGGNLSLLADSLGTSTELETKNKILVVEEVDEFAYRIDRMFTQLKRAGKLNHLAGLVIGHFTDMKETELPFGESFERIILNHVGEYTYPVAFNFPIGHKNPNLAWTHGGAGTLSVTLENSLLKF